MRLAVSCLLASSVALSQSMAQLNPGTSPSARRSSGMAAQPVASGERVWIFGGFDGAARNDLHYYDTAANTWVAAAQTNTPATRERHALGWSPKHGRLVMVGGMRQTSPLSFTWLDEVQVYDPATGAWTNYALPATRPAARADAAMHWVPSLQKFIYFGGTATFFASPRYNDVWLLDLDVANETAVWTQLPLSGPQPSGRGAACTAYDTDRDRLIVFGGVTDASVMVNDTHQYDIVQGRWENDAPSSPPTARAFCASAYDPLIRRMVLYGGQSGSNPVGGAFDYDPVAKAWRTLGVTPNPGPLSDPAAAFSAALGGMLLFGGRTGGTTYSDQTWVMRGNLPPTVDAGPDQSVAEQAMVSLSGSAADPEGGAVTYLWSQDGGPPVALSGATSATATFQSPAVTSTTLLTFVLEASDGMAAASDVTRVAVQDTINEPPLVDAGPDQSADAGTLVMLVGSASDPNGESLSLSHFGRVEALAFRRQLQRRFG